MKSIAVVLLIALAAFGLVAVADAQSGNSPAGTQTPATQPPSSGSSSASGSVSTPGGEVKGQVNVDRPGRAQAPAQTDSTRSDDVSALPRSAVTERTTIFGLSPTAAVIIAAALLVVVILAIVAMTRTGDTYIDTNRRV
jgi:hypothetical protein